MKPKPSTLNVPAMKEPSGLGGRKMSQSPNINGALSPINATASGPFSPQKTMGHNGFFNESNAKRWAESRRSMVSARYEKEISVRMEYEDKQKKLEKMLKEHKKMVKESV